MVTQHLIPLFERDLNKLKEEINLYSGDEAIWKVREGIINCGGNLCLHLVGNLQHFIGAVLGNSGYVRNREAEFKLRNIPRHKLVEEIDSTRSIVIDTLEQLTRNDLQKEYPQQIGGETVITEHLLIFLLAHFNYHLGQINYHRRIG